MKRCLIILLCFILLAGCQKSAPAQRTIFAMDTVMELKLYGTDADAAAAKLQILINDLESTWSSTRDDSIPNNETAKLTQEQSGLLDTLAKMENRTDGLYDMHLGGVMKVWGFYDKNYQVPTDAELTAAREENRLDLGGAMKGYAADQAVAILDCLDIDYAILDLGGNIQTYNSKPDGTPWQIGIQNPDGGDPLGVLSITGTTAIITSGDYQRSFTKDGKTYHHIIDPRTLCPAVSDLRSVTVICKNGLTADCLSTALYIMGLEEGSQFWRQSKDFEAVFITASGQIHATEGLTLTGCEYEVIKR